MESSSEKPIKIYVVGDRKREVKAGEVVSSYFREKRHTVIYAIPSKILASIFVYIDKIILKCIWKGKGSRIDKTILKNNNEGRGVSLPHFKT